jgi:bifunctional non-homologous end joining protein LigD
MSDNVPLTRYRVKRDFEATAEPAGDEGIETSRSELMFVVQKHQASSLHYDFRLEWNGVLVSWAVPKGPSLDPSVKRLAMAVEDHPIEYGDFEGVIPEGQYGGGTVMVWDRGSWVPDEADVSAAVQKGELTFVLNGQKLRGAWALIRTRGKAKGFEGSSWLLIKRRDRFASSDEVTAGKPRSVLSNLSMAGIAEAFGGNVAKAAKADQAAR